MWSFIAIVAFMATLTSIIGSIVLTFKRNILWKNWLMIAVIAFITLIVSINNIPTSP